MLGIVYCTIATHLIKKAGRIHNTAHTGAVTLIQRFGSALNLNIHLMCMDARMPRAHGCAGAAHMLFLDGVYIDGPNGARFRWVKAPTSAELTALAHTMAQRIGRYLERQGLLERDAENSYLASDAVDDDPMDQLMGHSITSATAPCVPSRGLLLAPKAPTLGALPPASMQSYRIAVGPQQGARCSPKAPTVGTLQTLPGSDDPFTDTLGIVAGFSLPQGILSPRPGYHLVHAGVSARAQQREKVRPVRPERLPWGTSRNACVATSQDRRYLRNDYH